MPIIIAGTIDLDPDRAAAIIDEARPFIEASLREDGCLHYAWSLDPLTPGRVRVFEEWTSEAALEGHFRDASYWSMRGHLETAGVRAADVKKYRFDLAERVYDAEGRPRADFFTESAAVG